jgi:hypothetical protein
MFEKKVLRRIIEPERGRKTRMVKACNERLNSLYSSLNIITTISGGTRWVRRVASMEEMRNAHNSCNYICNYFIGVTICKNRSRGSSGSIVSDYGLDDRGSIPGRGRGFFSQPLRPDRLWGPPSL